MPDTQADGLILYRAYVPRWAHAPLSGEGAARFGGRWNPVGAPTLYVARELSTAWGEYNQGFVQHPALIVQMRLRDARLADLMEVDALVHHGLAADIHRCQWRDLIDRGEEPPPHAARRMLMGRGYDGVVYPSFMTPGGACVALWCWGAVGPPSLDVIDPEGRLPKSAASWL